MTGIQFKILRLSVRLSAKKIANKLGFKSKTPVLEAEKLDVIPDKFVDILHGFTKMDFSNESVIEEETIKSVKQFRKLDYRNSIWESKYKSDISLNCRLDSKMKFIS